MLQWLPLALRIKCKILIVASKVLCNLALLPPPSQAPHSPGGPLLLTGYFLTIQKIFFRSENPQPFLASRETTDEREQAKGRQTGRGRPARRAHRMSALWSEYNFNFFYSPSKILFCGNKYSPQDGDFGRTWTFVFCLSFFFFSSGRRFIKQGGSTLLGRVESPEGSRSDSTMRVRAGSQSAGEALPGSYPPHLDMNNSLMQTLQCPAPCVSVMVPPEKQNQ